jgi:competence protein ComEC
MATNSGQADWQSYYRDQRILATFNIPESQGIAIIAPGGFAPMHWLRERARRALEKGFSKEQSVDHALLRALLLGDNDPQLRDIQAQFIRTGTSHHLSISGMHVAVLGGVVFFLCRLLRLSPCKSAIIMMAFVLLYGLVALPAPPVLRSIILCLSLGIGILFRRSIDGIQLLALTIFAMLLIHPLDLYNAGFQLSFLTVLGLMLYANRISRCLDRKDEDEQVLISLGIAPTRMRSIRNWIKSHLITDIATGIAAWAVSAPLILQHFDQINPWSIAAGLLLAIPVFGSMILGLLKIVLTIILPWFAPAWAWLAAMPVELMRLTVTWLAKIPGSDIALPALPLVPIILYYILLLLPLLPTARPILKWTFRAGAITACLAALFLPLIVILIPHHPAGLRLTLLSIGAGQCAVVELPSGKTILIDAGSSSIDDVERRCLEPFLRHEGVRKIDSIFISHANFDHFSAVAEAAEAYSVRQVLITPNFQQDALKNYAARLMLRKLAALKCPVNETTAGQTIQLDSDCILQILWPPEGAKLDANNSCQVMRLTYKGRSILFTGDIQIPAETALLAQSDELKSDILIAPHHGSLELSTENFINAVDPQSTLASDDATPSGKQRAFDEMIGDRPLLRTHKTGAITVTISPEGTLNISTFLKPK